MRVETVQRTSKKFDQIVETSKKLFMRFGMKRITIEEICRKANVSKMTFYKYFPNKIELVKYLWNAWADEGWEEIDTINALNIPFTEKLRLMIAWKLKLLSEMSPEFIEEYVHFDPEFKDFLQQYKQRNIRSFTDCIISWQKSGNVRPNIRPEFFIAVINKMQEMFDDDTLRKLYKDNVEFTHELHNIFFYGIIPHDVAEQK